MGIEERLGGGEGDDEWWREEGEEEKWVLLDQVPDVGIRDVMFFTPPPSSHYHILNV